MSGFSVESGKIVITDSARTVSTTDGTLVNLLPSPNFNATINVAFPDFSKGNFYAFSWISTWSVKAAYPGGPFISRYGWGSTGNSLVTVLPQEWAAETILGAVPAGADFFVGRVLLIRTLAPTHAWAGQPVTVAQPQSVWIPFNGSMVLEQEVAPIMARAFSIYIKDGNLVLHRQQSVGAGCGAYGPFGSSAPASSASSSGESSRYLGANGVPVHLIQSRSSSGETKPVSPYPPPYSDINQHKWDGSQPCSITDPTNYASTYSVQVIGQFGRRS